MFASACHSWVGLGVDWQAALGELRNGLYPVMFLTITERAAVVIGASLGCIFREVAVVSRAMSAGPAAFRSGSGWVQGGDLLCEHV